MTCVVGLAIPSAQIVFGFFPVHTPCSQYTHSLPAAVSCADSCELGIALLGVNTSTASHGFL